MPKWKNFTEYMKWRDTTINEDEQVHNMNHEEALKWVFSSLGIMDNANPKDKSQKDQINDALSSPLSSYPDKLEQLSTQLQLKNASNWPQIAAVIGAPERNTVSKLIAVISANATPKNTLSDAPVRSDDGDDGSNGHHYKEPDGRSPL
jgi:hypothetical protein